MLILRHGLGRLESSHRLGNLLKWLMQLLLLEIGLCLMHLLREVGLSLLLEIVLNLLHLLLSVLVCNRCLHLSRQR